MKGAPTTFWGKLDRDADGAVVEWHPLPAHCADVAACAEALLQSTLLRRRLAALARLDDFDEVDVARLSVIAALHDIGKFNLGFQRKGDATPSDTAGHVGEVLAVLGSDHAARDALLDVLPVDDLATWSAGEILELLVAAIGHHGRPVSLQEQGINPTLWKARGALDPFAGIRSLVAVVRAWFPLAFVRGHRPLPDSAALQHGFAGLVMLADWLGSDRDHFPFALHPGDRMPFARQNAQNALKEIGIDARVARKALGAETPGFERISEHPKPREAQVKTMALSRAREGSLTILESETGSGKTEAALGRFVQLFHAGLVDGMVFALPTRSAGTQLHARVHKAMKLAFPSEEARPPVVLAVPGYLQVDDAHGKRLPGFEVLWNDDERARKRNIGWPAETPKRFLAAPVAVGTIDQVLLSSLRVGHAHLRATALMRHLLVVDEVHASDAYMNHILEEVLRFHLDAGGHAFLMSATLGTAVRCQLEHAALGTNGSTPSLEAALATPYPVIHHAARGAAPSRIEILEPGLPKDITISLEAIADDPVIVAGRALAAARDGARVIVLRNTVSDAIATQQALEELVDASDEPLLLHVGHVRAMHHARYCRDDRVLLDHAVEERLGKQAPARGGVVVVATQTVQQSLDLDADILFTDLAPMDVLLQRFGRVHRHAERHSDRPRGYQRARAVVMTAAEPLHASLLPSGEARGRHGVGTVYEDVLILEATRRRLERSGTLQIPEQNRELVEVSTHPEALAEITREPETSWAKHWAKVFGIGRAHVKVAEFNLVERHQCFGEYSFKAQSDLGSERITTRLGENDRRAIFDTPLASPFGAKVRELSIPGWLAKGVPATPELKPSEVRAEEDRFRFSFGPVDFVYDRFGLRKEDAHADVAQDTSDA